MKLRNILILIYSAITLTSLGACSLIIPSEQKEAKKESSVSDTIAPTAPVEVKALEENNAATNVELIWEASSNQIDAFIIRYGMRPEQLDKELKVDSSLVEKYKDPNYGLVYRYVLRDIPPGQSIFVAISSIRKGVTSAPSPTFEVKAEDNPPPLK
ncbi:MAG: hypothetical protein GYA55_01230 [SAR324 cluster bacterium]|uniref:Fibronectin type-III domain-containing protein n=1 Tax=SAR324 cluster bacterium TaxID=2024889 RepID=A0A7X9IJ76_9DELT|nr:hypothetical protein [SAR324 cluster bacterium]